MTPFTRLDARAAPLLEANIDTDQLIPKQFLKTVDREGLGAGLLYEWRFDEQGREKPEFVLNRPEYKGTGVLIAGDNFGCGSSREHAPWALLDYGIRCVISSSFADIFSGNSLNNGLLLVSLPEEQVKALQDEAKGGNHIFTVDLEQQTVVAPSGASYRFEIDPNVRNKLLKGLDAIGETLEYVGDITRFEETRRMTQPWVSA